MINDQPPPSSADLMREQRLQRNLKIVVAVLSAFILLGLGAVAVRVIGLASGTSGSNQSSRIITVSPGATLSLEIPKGARIVSVSLSGNRLAVYYEGQDGPGIEILDIETGRRVLDVKPVESVPRN
ncbi:MAG TPA: hypothetical protein VIF39_02005 [Hyphomicrobium sp.]|jgi:hypothetical protein